ncbi:MULTISPECIES: chaplin [Streptomyces]|uniref:Small secreted domain n=3 Tax=Streptomyces TaxID=1883 RepID=A0A1I6NWW7_9ACTN|nr:MULTISPECIES: chaplin [Streptomyces]MCK1817541.1 chaplin [Streptomyces sp. XM4011]QKV70238.1 chaplin [Streptomyces harbinensis]UWM50649.1 chaplin [Streptomyces carpaticus]SFS32466.1 Small secreted domain [Streptomyces harbinensis]
MRIRTAIAATALAAAGVLGAAGTASADAEAIGVATHSPGVLSGNVVQVPIELGLNVCGNTVNILAFLNPTFGNVCVID